MRLPDRAREMQIVEAVQELIDLTTISHPHTDSAGDHETFVECRICGEVDGHTGFCFVAALLRWQQEKE